MRSLLAVLAVFLLGGALAFGQTTNQQDSPAPNGTAGTYSGNTPANTPDSDGTVSRAPAANPGATSRPGDVPHERNWGWIGIFGLAGLAGLRKRNRSNATSARTTATTESYGGASRGTAA